MIEAYEEILHGEARLRPPPGPRHEEICRRLHERVAACMAEVTVARLLPLRTVITLGRETEVRPDLALVTVATNKLFLAAEVVNTEDHSVDTVIKKAIYEDNNLPRLWMVDPRYDNVEIYHGGQFGLALKDILAVRDTLSEPLLPSFQYVITELFKM
ncbi:MAG TPA: Uma2 family endonuclease [Verrucomicrobiae bacterium]|jgi:Uma2 family endonuclease|nr:Uma2 family endonuclease [Verrucomicrobiae bacterium]